jgi:hypothetical protein
MFTANGTQVLDQRQPSTIASFFAARDREGLREKSERLLVSQTFAQLEPNSRMAQAPRRASRRGLGAFSMLRAALSPMTRRTYLNEATSAERESAIDRFPSRRGVQYSAIFSRQPAPHRFV